MWLKVKQGTTKRQIMKYRILLLGMVVAFSTMVSLGVRSWLQGQTVEARQKRAADTVAALPPLVPVTVKFKETLSAPGKPTILSTERVYGVRVDGSEVWIDQQHTNAGDIYLTHWHMLLADGTDAEGDDVTKTMTAVKLPVGNSTRALERWDPNARCTVQASGFNSTPAPQAEEMLLGVNTMKIVLRDSKTARITVWRAPSVNCLELRRLAEFKTQDGSVKDTSDLVATEVVLGEPNSSLFLLPTGEENISYSERYNRLVAAQGGRPVDGDMANLQRRDKMFSKFALKP
jgi:hypothetical protein